MGGKGLRSGWGVNIRENQEKCEKWGNYPAQNLSPPVNS